MKKLLAYFWQGCLVLVPVAVTAYVAYFVVATFDRLVPVGVPGLGFALALAFITLVGFLTSNVVGRAVVDAAERWLTSVPLMKLVYTSIRDLVDAFVGDRKRFDRAVSIAVFPGSQARVLGFVTRDGLSGLGMSAHVAVYVPQSYNFAGNLLILPREQVEPIEASSSDLMAFIVSGGISGLGVAPEPRDEPRKPRASRTILGLGPRQD